MHCRDEKLLSLLEAEMKLSVEGIEVKLWTQDMSGVDNKPTIYGSLFWGTFLTGSYISKTVSVETSVGLLARNGSKAVRHVGGVK